MPNEWRVGVGVEQRAETRRGIDIDPCRALVVVSMNRGERPWALDLALLICVLRVAT